MTLPPVLELTLAQQPGAAEAIEEAIRRFEQNKQTKVRKPKSEKVEDSGEEPPRKRQRKKKVTLPLFALVIT